MKVAFMVVLDDVSNLSTIDNELRDHMKKFGGPQGRHWPVCTSVSRQWVIPYADEQQTLNEKGLVKLEFEE